MSVVKPTSNIRPTPETPDVFQPSYRGLRGLPQRILRIAAVTASLLVAWEAAVQLLALPPFMLPGPTRVAAALWQQRIFLLQNASVTALETGLGLLLGAGLGALIALAMALYPPTRRVVLPVIVVSQALPVFAIAPLLVLWFGYGLSSKVAMAMLIIFFPVASAFHDGLRRTDPDLLALGTLYRASSWQILVHLRLPAALPALGSGLRVAAVFAPIGAVIGEWVGSSAGLGFVMLQANARVKTDLMFAALALLAVMAVLLRAAVDAGTRRLTPWQTED